MKSRKWERRRRRKKLKRLERSLQKTDPHYWIGVDWGKDNSYSVTLWHKDLIVVHPRTELSDG